MLHPVVGTTTLYQADEGEACHPALVVAVNTDDGEATDIVQTVNLVFWDAEGETHRRLNASACHPEGDTPHFIGGTDPDNKADVRKPHKKRGAKK